MEAGADRFAGLVENVPADNVFVVVAVTDDSPHDLVGCRLQ